jgi:hypothetical protein
MRTVLYAITLLNALNQISIQLKVRRETSLASNSESEKKKPKSPAQTIADISTVFLIFTCLIITVVIFGALAQTLLGNNFTLIGNLVGSVFFAFALFVVLKIRQLYRLKNKEVKIHP